MLFEHSVVTWVAFCSTRIGSGLPEQVRETHRQSPRRLPFELASIFKGLVSILVAREVLPWSLIIIFYLTIIVFQL